jgi:hypothetical protein
MTNNRYALESRFNNMCPRMDHRCHCIAASTAQYHQMRPIACRANIKRHILQTMFFIYCLSLFDQLVGRLQELVISRFLLKKVKELSHFLTLLTHLKCTVHTDFHTDMVDTELASTDTVPALDAAAA